MGITIRQVVEEIGGGIADGRTFKAVQVGAVLPVDVYQPHFLTCRSISKRFLQQEP